MAMATSSLWTPDFVEEQIFNIFKGEDVSGNLPSVPVWVDEEVDLGEAGKHLLKFCESGAVAPLSSMPKNHANTSNASYCSSSVPGTPKKGLGVSGISMNTAGSLKTPKKSPTAGPLPPTPKEKTKSPVPAHGPVVPGAVKKSSSRVTSETRDAQKRTREGPNTPGSGMKRARGEGDRKIVWPAHVPTDAELKGESRSKLAPFTTRRIAAQDGIDPDIIFAQPGGEIPLQVIFAKHPAGLMRARQPRTLSGNWQNDTFSPDEEAHYKDDMKFVYAGPSQAATPSLF